MKDPLEEAAADVKRPVAAVILIAIVAGLVGLAILRPQSRDALLIVFGLVLMVMLHEAGHYVAARRTGMKATEFFLGFGPRLWSFKKGETEYGVKAIPLGGYVKIVGMTNMDEIAPEDEPRAYRNGSHKNRLIVVLAGVTVNFLLAFVFLFAAYAGPGRVPTNRVTTSVDRIVHYVSNDKGKFVRDDSGHRIETAAYLAGFRSGDHIVAVDGEPIARWKQLTAAIEKRGGESTTFTVVRKGNTLDLEATPTTVEGQGFLGISPSQAYRSIGILGAAGESFNAIGRATTGTASAIGRLFTPSGLSRYSKGVTGSAAPPARDRLCSIVCIVDQGSRLVNGNVWALFQLLGLVSLVLALFNTLPLLPFDGGHAAVVVYEAIASRVKRRKVRVDYRKLMPVTAIVLAFFLLLGLSAMFADIRNLGS